MKKLHFLVLIGIGLVLGCQSGVDVNEPPVGAPAFSGEAYRPIYASENEVNQVTTEAPQPLKKPGKIYVRGNYLFINEQGKGIHLVDNSDPRNPKKMSFIKIWGNVDMAVKGNFLYADSGPDFVVLNITDPAQVKVEKRIKNAFPSPLYPPYNETYFECVEPSKGVVVGWEKVKMNRPKCFR